MADAALAETTSLTAPLRLTAAAARRIRAILPREPGAIALRLAVNGGGCSGFSYAFELTPTREADDIAVETDGALLLVDPVSLDILNGSEVDYVQDLIGASFQVRNPNAKSGCGCGTSFSV
jgi:iron-sulfur cluster assembly accessory protein